MEMILPAHARRYPLMEPRDAVKLVYQSEFGGGHLIRDEAACLAYLRREYAAVAQTPGALLEDIGNGIVRVQLSALDAHGYTPEQLGRDFIRSAAMTTGSMDMFRARLTLLTELTAAGKMPFPPGALAQYLAEYEKAGFPPVSHSESYRNAYHPAYRVVRQDCLPQNLQSLLTIRAPQ